MSPMDRLRQTAPILSLLLALVVAGETTDVLPCADGECGVWRALVYPDASPSGGLDHRPAVCPCQVVFASTAVLPAAPVPAPDDGALWLADPACTPSLPGRVPHPPPRG